VDASLPVPPVPDTMQATPKSTDQERPIVFAGDYPFMDILWTMILFFSWVVWIWMMVAILADVFSRRDISGWGKAAWTVFLIAVPFLGTLAYLIANHDGMADRKLEGARVAQADIDDHIRSVARNGGSDGAAAEIQQAKALLDSGAIDQGEFATLKAKALA